MPQPTVKISKGKGDAYIWHRPNGDRVVLQGGWTPEEIDQQSIVFHRIDKHLNPSTKLNGLSIKKDGARKFLAQLTGGARYSFPQDQVHISRLTGDPYRAPGIGKKDSRGVFAHEMGHAVQARELRSQKNHDQWVKATGQTPRKPVLAPVSTVRFMVHGYSLPEARRSMSQLKLSKGANVKEPRATHTPGESFAEHFRTGLGFSLEFNPKGPETVSPIGYKYVADQKKTSHYFEAQPNAVKYMQKNVFVGSASEKHKTAKELWKGLPAERVPPVAGTWVGEKKYNFAAKANGIHTKYDKVFVSEQEWNKNYEHKYKNKVKEQSYVKYIY